MKMKITYGVIGLIAVGILSYIFWPQEPMVVENINNIDTVDIVESVEQAPIKKSSTGSVQPVVKKVVTPTKTTKILPKNVYVVTYTNKGFEPSELQIPKGSSVKFVNKTNTSMRIFADDEAKPPYSELNQPKALGLNGEYVFNFVYSGVWAYYNSLKPSDTASIVAY